MNGLTGWNDMRVSNDRIFIFTSYLMNCCTKTIFYNCATVLYCLMLINCKISVFHLNLNVLFGVI